jgi:hydrogenase-4 component F
LFLSELSIIRAGLSGADYFLVGLMALLLIVIFIGFLNHFRTMYFDNGDAETRPVARVSRWCVTPMWLALLPLLVMGLWWPQLLWDHFQAIAHGLDLRSVEAGR